MVECYLSYEVEKPDIKERELVDFSLSEVGASVQQPPETQYQDGFYHCPHLHLKGSLVSCPEYGSEKGQAEEELLREGVRLEQYSSRFSPGGAYIKTLDYIDLDSVPMKPHPIQSACSLFIFQLTSFQDY